MDRVGKIDLLFQSVLARFFSIPARQPASGNVTFAQMRILWMLEMKGTLTQGDVARWLGVSKSTATELVDRLVRGDYVRREQGRDDRRQVNVSLRPRGRTLLAEFARRRQERFRRLLGVVASGDVTRMVAALETMNEILAKWNGKTR